MVNRRGFLTGLGAACVLAATTPGVASAGAMTGLRAGSESRPLAVVYRGPASLPGCPEAVATLLQNSPRRFRTIFVGPGEQTPISASVLAGAAVYAQPGGPSLSKGWAAMSEYAEIVRNYVAGGGAYLGFCLGGYLAGATPGFDLLPGDTWQYITAADATVRTTKSARITVNWRGAPQTLYFQDGPAFWLRKGADAHVIATYAGGQPAALVAPYGAGRVGVVGPHPEADRTWFGRLDSTGAIHPELGYDLIEETLARRAA